MPQGEAKVPLGQGPCACHRKAAAGFEVPGPGSLAQSCSHLEEGRAEPLLVIVRWLHMGPAFVLATGSLGRLLLLRGLSCHLCLPILLPIFQANPLGLGLSQVTALGVSFGRFLAGTLPLVCVQVLVEPFLGSAVPAREGEAGTVKGAWGPVFARFCRQEARCLDPALTLGHPSDWGTPTLHLKDLSVSLLRELHCYRL